VLLDGEIVAIDPADGAPSFARLQSRMHVTKPSEQLLAAVPVQLYVFDILELDGAALIDEPYQRRRELLDDLTLTSDLVQTPPWYPDEESGQDLLTAARQAGLEGVVSKRLTSPYRPGRRSPEWIKAPLQRTTEAIIVGSRPGEGRRHGMIGSLVLAAHDEQGRLVHIGDVGTGFTEQALRQIADRLQPLARDNSPLDEPLPRGYARDARWVHPVLVGDVAYPDRLPRSPAAPPLLAGPAIRPRTSRREAFGIVVATTSTRIRGLPASEPACR
jgi:bifunctional non-homologous end joining protein LigD